MIKYFDFELTITYWLVFTGIDTRTFKQAIDLARIVFRKCRIYKKKPARLGGHPILLFILNCQLIKKVGKYLHISNNKLLENLVFFLTFNYCM